MSLATFCHNNDAGPPYKEVILGSEEWNALMDRIEQRLNLIDQWDKKQKEEEDTNFIFLVILLLCLSVYGLYSMITSW